MSYFGSYLAAVPPLDGIGERDLLVNAPVFEDELGNTGLTYRYDGLTDEIVDVVTAPTDWTVWVGYGALGPQVDVNEDGIMDLLVHRFIAGFQGQPIAAAILAGPMYETTLTQFVELSGAGAFGRSAAFSDLDRDGDLDLLLSDSTFLGSGQGGAVYVYRGPDFGTIEILGPQILGFTWLGFGKAVMPGDLDGDGIDEIYVQSSATGQGRLFTFEWPTLTADATQLSTAAGASVGFTIDLPDEWAGYGYVAGLSLHNAEDGVILGPGSHVPFTPDGLTGLGLALLGTPVLPGFSGTLDASGDSTMALLWPPGVATFLAGRTLHVAALTMAPDGTYGPGTTEVTIDLLP